MTSTEEIRDDARALVWQAQADADAAFDQAKQGEKDAARAFARGAADNRDALAELASETPDPAIRALLQVAQEHAREAAWIAGLDPDDTDRDDRAIWVVLSHGDAGAFPSGAFASALAALRWAQDNETGGSATFRPDSETGAGWVWDDDPDGPPALTVRVTRLVVERDPARDSGPEPDVTSDVTTLRKGATAALASLVPWDDEWDTSQAVSALLATAASRLEEHPRAQGPMTQAALRIARTLTGDSHGRWAARVTLPDGETVPAGLFDDEQEARDEMRRGQDPGFMGPWRVADDDPRGGWAARCKDGTVVHIYAVRK